MISRVVLTHPDPRNARVARQLRACGFEVVALATRRLVPLRAERCDPAHPLNRLATYDWVIPVSPGAVEAAFDDAPRPWPALTAAAVVGPGTAKALAARGVCAPAARVVSPSSPPYDADALLALPEFQSLSGKRVLVVRGEAGRRDWIEQLRTRGAAVDVVSAYRSEPVDPNRAELAELTRWAGADAPAAFVFSSVDAIDATLALLARQGSMEWALRQPALVLHARHARRLDEAGWRRTRLIEPGESMLVQALESA